MTDDFSNYPMSITEARGEKSKNGSDWTARDAIISALRDIDSGAVEMPQFAIILLGGLDKEEKTYTRFYNATPNRYIHMGLIQDHIRRLSIKDATGEY